MDRLRALALEGLDASHDEPTVAPRRRARDDGRAPAIDPSAPSLSREPLTAALREGAALEWRRASHAWMLPLDRVLAAGPLAVTVRRGVDVDVTLRNGMQRARDLPRPWVAVIVAVLTGRELPAVRAALKRGVNLFAPETPTDPKEPPR